jgi:hypothetical protein
MKYKFKRFHEESKVFIGIKCIKVSPVIMKVTCKLTKEVYCKMTQKDR